MSKVISTTKDELIVETMSGRKIQVVKKYHKGWWVYRIPLINIHTLIPYLIPCCRENLSKYNNSVKGEKIRTKISFVNP